MLTYLANGELDHDSCEATVSTEAANHDVEREARIRELIIKQTNS